MSDEVKPSQESLDALALAQDALANIIKALNLKPDYYSLAEAVEVLQGVVCDMRIDCKYPSESTPYDMPALSSAAQESVASAANRKKGYTPGSAKRVIRGY